MIVCQFFIQKMKKLTRRSITDLKPLGRRVMLFWKNFFLLRYFVENFSAFPHYTIHTGWSSMVFKIFDGMYGLVKDDRRLYLYNLSRKMGVISLNSTLNFYKSFKNGPKRLNFPQCLILVIFSRFRNKYQNINFDPIFGQKGVIYCISFFLGTWF